MREFFHHNIPSNPNGSTDVHNSETISMVIKDVIQFIITMFFLSVVCELVLKNNQRFFFDHRQRDVWSQPNFKLWILYSFGNLILNILWKMKYLEEAFWIMNYAKKFTTKKPVNNTCVNKPIFYANKKIV
jgi:hypothetical protein